ncbi:TBC1 domain family member 16-like isoform X1 [Pecten maximus]|uniref:TBC1 domain family member 16-like isoform X1 n=1 Tax=Pecten maximus TaxID=6579 RepID=UPI0014581834|nr:TBC1 domain family member 16-like isoform X1 [Pecten maximus]
MDPVMAFSTIFKKASNFLGIGSDSPKHPPLDGEIIYCKNNVCVHPPAPMTMDTEHHPGYLTLRSQHEERRKSDRSWVVFTTGKDYRLQNNGPTLILTWIPNSSLKKNPRSIENSPNRTDVSTPKVSPRRPPRPDFARSDQPTPSPSSSPRGSCVSVSSDVCDVASSKVHKRISIDNGSMVSECSREDYCDSWGPHEDLGRKLSTSNKSQTDSGIGPDEVLQNNELPAPSLSKGVRVGLTVNNLHCQKEGNTNGKMPPCLDSSSPDTSDGLTPEEQLAAMLNRNKLRAKPTRDRIDSNKSVSIEMNGDNLVVVTEEVDRAEKYDFQDCNINKNDSKFDSSSSTDIEQNSLSSDSTHTSPSGGHYSRMVQELCEDTNSLTESPKTGPNVPTQLQLVTDNQVYQHDLTTPDISVTRYRLSSSSTSTSGPDSGPPSPSLVSSPDWDQPPDTPSSCESGAHNLTFPHNSLGPGGVRHENKCAKDQVCGVFSVDLGQMRSLRLFYSDRGCSKGQVVIASRESQYKILHFHHGGLDKLAEIFDDWNLFAKTQEKNKETDRNYSQFLIVRPQLTDEQCHPEEGVYSVVCDEMWKRHMTVDGIIEEDFQLRKSIFFGGLEPSLRHETWPFLLHYYPYRSTYEEREHIRNDRYIDYQNIRKIGELMTEEEQDEFWRKIQSIVEKDVVRTDRTHPYFRGEDNPNIEVLKNILLNYAMANPHMGYTQGMSDLLAPVLAEIQNEADAYWCFTGLMQRTLFVSSPKDSDMDKQLNYLRELIRIMLPDFYMHLKRLGQDAMELLFCHRWILLCFKREFPEGDALKIWESCWAHYQTDYFHLFICVAIVSIYGDDVIDQGLPADEILLHFSSLAMHMNGDMVLRKARGLLHQYRKIPKIPCTLHGLCTLCGPGMWDSGHVPIVACVGNHPDGVCPYHSNPSTPNSPDHQQP